MQQHFEQAAHIVSDYVFGEAGFLGDVADKYLQNNNGYRNGLIAIYCIDWWIHEFTRC